MENTMQLDVMHIEKDTAVCNLWADGRCVKIVMARSSYETLCGDGFFIRNGKTKDGAGVINTTTEYLKRQINSPEIPDCSTSN